MAQGRLQTAMAGLTCTSVIGVITLALVLLQHHQPGPVVDSTMPTAPAVREQVDPTEFTPEELQTLQKRFGVHGPQPRLAQLFTSGMDQLQPLRMQTLERLAKLKPVILRESRQRRINPMLITAILFDEIQHSKPGEDLPFIAHSGLVKTHGPAQIGISELIHQKLLPLNPSPDDIAWARDQLLDPSANISLLAGKMQRLKTALPSGDAMLQASASTVTPRHWRPWLICTTESSTIQPGAALMQDPNCIRSSMASRAQC